VLGSAFAASVACGGNVVSATESAIETGSEDQKASYLGKCPTRVSAQSPDPLTSTARTLEPATCTDLMHAHANYNARCSLQDPLDKDSSAARSRLCEVITVAKGSLVTALDLGHCVDLLRTASCNLHAENTWCHDIVYGTHAPKGSLPVGSTCGNKLQCASGECALTSCGSSRRGICVVRVKDEEACDSSHLCEESTGSCRDGRCRRGPYPGEPCAVIGKIEPGPCQTGSVCDMAHSTGLGARGALCKRDSTLNYCVTDSDCPGCGFCKSTGVCETYAELGESCGTCKPGAICTDGRCVPSQAPSRPRDGSCADRDDCSDSEFCVNGRCRVPQANLKRGDSCYQGDTCAPGLGCTPYPTATCQPLPKLGEDCSAQQCAPPAVCSAGPATQRHVCTLPAAVGEACDYLPGCTQGATCIGFGSGKLGVCKRTGGEGAACGPNDGPCFVGFDCLAGRCRVATGECN
jgi:hypothetical protein